MAMVAMTFCSQAWLGAGAPAQAAPVTDTFKFTATFKERCQGDPRFVDIQDVTAAEGITLTLTRDPLDTGDLTAIRATLNNTEIAGLNAITMNGRIFPKNSSGSAAKFALSGRNPGNPDHFLTILGNATFLPPGNLTKAAGTLMLQIIDLYGLPNGGGDVQAECIINGTFETKAKLAPSGGSADIDVTAATPASGTTNISGTGVTVATTFDTLNSVPVTRVQVDATVGGIKRQVLVYFATTGGAVQAVSYFWGTASLFENIVYCPLAGCADVSVNQTTKTITFVNTALDDHDPAGSITKVATLNGAIQYP
jgi:hypothetical protein